MLLRFNSRGRLIAIASTMLALLSFAGCGPEAEPMGILSGTVKSGEKLIGNCKIAIYNPKTLQSIGATVDESATFELKEVPFGEYEVKVYPKPSDAVDEIPDPRIPQKFRNQKTSGITVSIDKQEIVVLDINMK